MIVVITMKIIGIIAEYNPFHNGHIYHINSIKEKYPDSLIILILNGYFLMRGEISLLSKQSKTEIALKNKVDLVIEHPFFFSSNSADIFASSAVYLLDKLKCDYLIFGSESNNIDKLIEIANKQFSSDFNNDVKTYLKQGINYPTALNKALNVDLNTPNDLLGVSYIKAIKELNSNIIPKTIQRSNDYHDKESNNDIISATNIRNKIKNKEKINTYLPIDSINKLNIINNELLFTLIKYQVLTNSNLSDILSVDEGIDKRILNIIKTVNNYEDLVKEVKTKRYTYNRINRTLIHILHNYHKLDKIKYIYPPYIKILGFNNKGQNYLNSIKKDINIEISTKISNNIVYDLELKSASLYELLTKEKVTIFEKSNKPIKID